MLKDRISKHYEDGVENFIAFALQNAIKTPSNAHVYNVETRYSIHLKRLKNIYSFMELIKVTILDIGMGRQLVVANH